MFATQTTCLPPAGWRWKEDSLQTAINSETGVALNCVPKITVTSLSFCEEVWTVSVVTPFVRGGAQVLHGDQNVKLSTLLEVHEKEEEEKDGEGQVEAECERGELKERRT